MRGLGCARKFRELVAWQGVPTLVIERDARGAADILQVMDRSASQACEERAFRDSVSVEVRKTRHGLVEDRVQFIILDVSVGPFYAVLGRTMNSHFVGALETGSPGGDGASHAQPLDDRLVLPPTKELLIDNSLPTSPSHV
jgi:hypothetical protein